MDDLILDIFYKEIISELNTKKGKIKIQDNLYYFPFSVAIEEEKIPSSSYELSDDFSFAPPVLMIRDKESFEPLLVEFIKQQLQLINEEENLRHYLTLCCGENIHNQIKYLLLLVWKNATSEDFIHPQAFLTKRIQFFTKEDITTPLEAPLDMNQGLGIVSEVNPL